MTTSENINFPERIKELREEMLVHSYIYYWEYSLIVTDNQWQRWADELTSLQKSYQEPLGFYDEVFKDWNGNTGMHLPQDEWIKVKARKMLDEDIIGKTNGNV